MLTGIKSLFRDRRDRREMLDMRTTMVAVQSLLFPKNEITSQLVRAKTGWALRNRLENRLGIMGPDFMNFVNTDYDLNREAKFLDGLPWGQLVQLSSDLGYQAGRTLLERGGPDEWNEDSGEPSANVAHLLALRLLSGWLKCKAIIHTSANRKVVTFARRRRTGAVQLEPRA